MRYAILIVRSQVESLRDASQILPQFNSEFGVCVKFGTLCVFLLIFQQNFYQ